MAPKHDRSALDALQVVEDLRKRGVALHLLFRRQFMSKLFLTTAEAFFAEAEQDRIRERIRRPAAAVMREWRAF